jgi:hypothetical protein
VPGFVEVAGIDHGADRARQALHTQWRCRGGGSGWRAVGRRGSAPHRGSRWRRGHPRNMRHRRPARTVLGDTFRHPLTFTHDTVGHIGRTWGVSWCEGPMCLARRSTFRPINPRPPGWLPRRGRVGAELRPRGDSLCEGQCGRRSRSRIVGRATGG